MELPFGWHHAAQNPFSCVKNDTVALASLMVIFGISVSYMSLGSDIGCLDKVFEVLVSFRAGFSYNS